MALMTGEQYIESIRNLHMNVYMFGKRIENPTDNPILRPSLNSVRMTYDLAQMPEYQELMTVVSPETGKRINRFTHIHRSTEDLRNKVKMQRLLLSMLYTLPHMRLIKNTVLITTIISRNLCWTLKSGILPWTGQ